MAKIKKITVREILDSRGNPTIECTVILEDGKTGTASCPSGVSVGTYEAIELRDNDPQRLHGMGVLKAMENIIQTIAPKLTDIEVTEQGKIDYIMISLDGTKNKEKLGANAILAVSLAVCKAAALSLNTSLYSYIKTLTMEQPSNLPAGRQGETIIPTPIFNIINGGKHAGGNIDFQEFMIIPTMEAATYSQKLIAAVTIYQTLRKNLAEKRLPTLVGDEGGFAPMLQSNAQALQLIKDAIEENYKFGIEIGVGLDVAANTFYKNGSYTIKDSQTPLPSEKMISFYRELQEGFDLLYLEDPLAEDDWDSWTKLNSTISTPTLIVGDDLVVTNLERLQMSIDKKAISAVIVKPNQIGTLTETIDVVKKAKASGIKIVVSHRSGETTDDFIADFAVGIGADFAKFGAPARGERVVKYNRLLKIEEEINK